MSNSSLVNYRNILNGHCNDRQGNKIDKIVIHHAAGQLSVEQFYNIFNSRQSSATYAIGSDGRIGQYVDEAYRPWTTSSWEIDKRAVTIEVSNDGGAPDWHVSDKNIAVLIKLVADICKRNGIKNCTYTGDKSGVLQMHKWHASTQCPGPYLGSKFSYIATEVNKILGAKTTTTTTSASNASSKPDQILSVGSKVKSYVMTAERIDAKKDNGNGWVYSSLAGGWIPCRDVIETDARDGRNDQILHVGSHFKFPNEMTVGKIMAGTNNVYINELGYYVNANCLEETKNGK